MEDLIGEFLVETYESLEELDSDFVRLEQEPEDAEILGNIFRLMHTIKGTCGFLGLPRLEKVAHAAENVMDKLRDCAFVATPPVISLIFEATDQVKAILDHLQELSVEPEGDDAALIAKLNECADSNGASMSGDGAAVEAAAPVALAVDPAANLGDDAMALGGTTPDLDEEIDFEPVMAPTDDVAADAIKTPDLDEEIDFEPVMAPTDDVAVPDVVAKPAVAKKQRAVKKGLEESATPVKRAAPVQTIRVGLDVLEDLMQQVGELVLTRNQLMQIMSNAGSSLGEEFALPFQRLNQITSELQDGVMKTRMQPISNAWSKFPRLIRDLSMDLGKKIELKMIGEDTEIDRQMLEAIKDPLTHMVRNSADHGLEGPDERVAAGKSEEGRVTLSAQHEGGHVVIKIVDNGRGLNTARIKEKIIENDMATAEEVEEMSEKQIHQHILKAGFSTAVEITAVSGRGVGMDVVVSNIEKIGGSVQIKSVDGQGSEFIIQLPLTLAIMPVLIVESCGEIFAIPQIRVSEIVRAGVKDDDGEGTNVIEEINGAPVLRLRGRLLPLIPLEEALQLEPKSAVEELASEVVQQVVLDGVEGDVAEEPLAEIDVPQASNDNDSRPFIVVCETGRDVFGVLVDRIFHTEEIVVKPVSPLLQHLPVYAGATILGDGAVIMIIDPQGLLQILGKDFSDDTATGAQEEAAAAKNSQEQFLLFKAWSASPFLVPLELVSRLEEVNLGEIESSGGKPVVQYRGGLMNLTMINASRPMPTEGVHDVIVFSDEDKVMGVVVEEVLDIVNQEVDIHGSANEAEGTLGSMVVHGATTDLIDISKLFEGIFSDWLTTHKNFETGVGASTDSAQKILMVDDSPFFRKFMTPVLTVEGYDVTVAAGGAEALEILATDGQVFDLILSDIDMPEMDGLEFTALVKADETLAGIPVVALTSHTQDELFSHAKDPGFDGFVSKSERNQLVSVIQQVLTARSEAA